MGLTFCLQQNVPRASRTLSADDLLSRKKDTQRLEGDSYSAFTHVLDETVDDLENLRCSRPSLVVGESI